MTEQDGELRARLRRLRREPMKKSAPEAKPLPVWVAKSLRRRAPGATKGSAEASDGATRATKTVDPPADLVHVETAAGAFAVRSTVSSADETHGTFRLDEVDHACTETLALLTRDETLAGMDLRNAVYLDVETTGLSGGAGTISFLVALGAFTGDEFELWQGFLPGPENEHALLAEVAERIRGKSAVVSFFGKSFDRHRLEDKMRLHGVAPPFADVPHLDLYHPCARLYREAFPDGRLATMEAALCGVEREDDLPGSLAPEAWFDFLAGRAHRLEGVFTHNALDVLSLVTLAAHVGRTLDEERADGSVLAGPGWARARALARLYAERRERDAALTWVERALERHEEEERSLRFLKAELLRGLTRDDEALALYEELAGEERDELCVRAWIEIAKLAEHRLRDAERAIAAVRTALSALESCAPGPRLARHRRDLEHRGERLRAKTDG